MNNLRILPDNEAIDAVEREMLKFPGVLTAEDFPVEHYFAPQQKGVTGLYARSLFRPAGTFIVGHAHKHSHLSIVLHGRLRVLTNGQVREIVGPSKPFLTEAGVRKATYAVEDTTLITFHPTNTTDPDKLEAELVDKSETFLSFEEKREADRIAAAKPEEMLVT